VRDVPLTCTTDNFKDEFNFDVWNVVPVQYQPHTSKQSVSS